MNIRQEQFTAVIERTNDPLAIVKLPKAWEAIENLGFMLSHVDGVSKAKCDEIVERLMGHFSKEELDELSSSPEWVMVVASMLARSIEGFVRESVELKRSKVRQ